MAKKRSASLSLPEDVIPIYRFHLLPERDFGSVCGVVVDFMAIKQSKGPDFQQTITIKDMHNGTNNDQDNVLTVKIFKKEERLMPPVERKGDVIYFKRLKNSRWANRIVGLYAWDSNFALFLTQGLLSTALRHSHEVVNHHGKVTVVRPDAAGDISAELQDYAISLGRRLQGPSSVSFDVNQSSRYPSVPSPSVSNFGAAPQASHPRGIDSFWDERYSQIGNLTTTSYSVMLIGEMVKMFENPPYLDVYVTDYTSSPLLLDRSDNQGMYVGHPWPGPNGRMTLRLEVHEPHRSWIRMNLKEREIAMFRNVKCKLARSGVDLEATLWPDRKYPDKVLVNHPLPGDSRVQSLLERKLEYDKEWKPESAFAVLNESAKNYDRNVSRSKKRKNKKQQRQQAKEEAHRRPRSDQDATGKHSNVKASTTTTENVDGSEDKEDDLTKEGKKLLLNRRLETLSTHRFSTFSEVVYNHKRRVQIPLADGPGATDVELPFINVNHRVRLRVVDYEPKEVFEFIRGVPSSSHLMANSVHEWSFTLLVVVFDPSYDEEQPYNQIPIPIHVDNEAGKTLLGVEARAVVYDEDDQKALAKAQEKFYALVGSELPQEKDVSSKDSSLDSSPLETQLQKPNFSFWQKQRNQNRASPNAWAVSEPFEACIREYGVQCDHQDGECDGQNELRPEQRPWEKCVLGWRRMWGLHSTRICGAEAVPFRRAPGEGTNIQAAIALDSSDEDHHD